jgi:tetratricopeptide (TPR) repeat protein
MFRGVSHYQRGEFKPAIADFEQAVHKDLTIYEGYRFLAACHIALDDWERAQGDFEQAMKLRPGDDKLRIEFIETALSLRKFETALISLDRLITAHPDWPHSYLVRSIVRWLGGKDLQLARADLDRAIVLEPRDWSFHMIRAVLNYRRAEYAGALGDLGRCSLVLCHTKFAVRWHVEQWPGGHGRFFIGLFWRYQGGASQARRNKDAQDLEHKLVDLGLRALWGSTRPPAEIN